MDFMTYAEYRKVMRKAGGTGELLYCAEVDGQPWIGNSYYAYTVTNRLQHAKNLLPDLEPRMYAIRPKELLADNRPVPNMAQIIHSAREKATEKAERAEYHGREITVGIDDVPLAPFEIGETRVYLNAGFLRVIRCELQVADKVLACDPLRPVLFEGEYGQGIIMPVRV